MWYLNDDLATPPPPPIIPPVRRQAGQKQPRSRLQTGPPTAQLLTPGCWLIQVVPRYADDVDPNLAIYPVLRGWDMRYVGTLRVEKCSADAVAGKKKVEPGSVRASGDLYVQRHPWTEAGTADPPPLTPPSPPVEIPIFRRQDYAFYFTVQSVTLLRDGQVELKLACFQFDAKKFAWNPAPILTATLHRAKPTEIPPAWRQPRPRPYLIGEVYNNLPTKVADLQIGWISPYLREASIAIATAPGLTAPTSNGQGDDVKSVFAKLDWKINVHAPITAPVNAAVWEAKDLHAFMTVLEEPVSFDDAWVYSALVVPRFDSAEVYGFGKMYDGGALDTDLIPREGLLVAADAKFPADARFGPAQGQMLKNVPRAAFFNFMHELGHAMGLFHRFTGSGFMQELVYFALRAAADQPPFPDNLPVSYHTPDEVRLRHHPDNFVRPKAVPYGVGYLAAPVPDTDIVTDVGSQLQLTVTPLRRVLPMGAPMRLELRLTNIQDGVKLPGPARLSLADGSVAGRVIAPNGQVRSFSAVAPLDYQSVADLDPRRSLFHGETLWRGPEGALFPAPGVYRVELEAIWVAPGGVARSATHCDVLIEAPENRRHQHAAIELLASEDVTLLLILRVSPDGASAVVNKRLTAAVKILRDSLEVQELRPSLAPLEARRLASTDLVQAAGLIDDDSWLTTSEIDYLLTQVKEAPPDIAKSAAVGRLIAVCRRKIMQAFCARHIDQAEVERLLGLEGGT
ncbi:MAG TPA: hypothetical protein VHR45_18610 [Thermoanaerobaculia bacterium]|nr:hypothetical protein [Thermoanaerobaculia bacterium]